MEARQKTIGPKDTEQAMIRRALFACAVAAGLLGACASPEEDICDGKCACEGCSPDEHGKCLQELDADRAAAEHRGCVGTYHDFAECEAATGVCVAGDWKTSCKLEHESFKSCVDDK
jgi:hypothetical protein